VNVGLDRAAIKKILFLIASAMFLLLIVINFGTVLDAVGYVIGLLMPLIIGCCMAFILNVLMKFTERRVLGALGDPGDRASRRNLRRAASLLLTLLIVFGILVFVFAMIIPTLQDTVSSLFAAAPGHLKTFERFLLEHASRFGLDGDIREIFGDIRGMFGESGSDFIDRILAFLSGTGSWVAKSAAGMVSDVFSGMTSAVLGFIFAIYILLTKETLGRQMKRLITAYLPQRHGGRILEVAALAQTVFERFVAGQCLEAIIIGVLAGLGTLAINSSFALMLGVLIGFSALIPVVGAIVGVVIGAFLLLMESPLQALAFIVFIIVLQQLENHIIYPKVVGKSIGLPGMWVLLAVLVGGTISGILGIVVGVPLASVLYSLLRADVGKRLDRPEDAGARTEEISRAV
jgi:predicted PurR-regulated permease PerM